MSKRKRISATEISRVLKKRLLEILATAFSFVAALFWRDVILELINTYKFQIEKIFPFNGVLFLKFTIALLVSVFAVLIIYFLTRILKNN